MNLAGAVEAAGDLPVPEQPDGRIHADPRLHREPELRRPRRRLLGFQGVQLDGNDPVAFHNGMKEVIDDVRAGKGPVFVEALTLRLGPHAGVGCHQSPARKEELAAAKAAWPVPCTRALLLERGICTEEELTAIDSAAKAEVEEAVAVRAGKRGHRRQTKCCWTSLPIRPCVPKRGQREKREAEAPHTGETREMAMFEAVQDAQELAHGTRRRGVLPG